MTIRELVIMFVMFLGIFGYVIIYISTITGISVDLLLKAIVKLFYGENTLETKLGTS